MAESATSVGSLTFLGLFAMFSPALVLLFTHPADLARVSQVTDRSRPLERDDFSLKRHPALSLYLSMIFSENRYPLFRIMLDGAQGVTVGCLVRYIRKHPIGRAVRMKWPRLIQS
jgi:hypothetical protein